jgi:hypothetical protein
VIPNTVAAASATAAGSPTRGQLHQPHPVGELAHQHSRHLGTTIAGILAMASRNGCTLRDSLVTFLKQLLYIDGVCRELDPDFDVIGDTRPIISMARDPLARAHNESTMAA